MKINTVIKVLQHNKYEILKSLVVLTGSFCLRIYLVESLPRLQSGRRRWAFTDDSFSRNSNSHHLHDHWSKQNPMSVSTVVSKPTQEGRVLDALVSAAGAWVNGQYFLRSLYLSQYHRAIWNLENRED